MITDWIAIILYIVGVWFFSGGLLGVSKMSLEHRDLPIIVCILVSLFWPLIAFCLPRMFVLDFYKKSGTRHEYWSKGYDAGYFSGKERYTEPRDREKKYCWQKLVMKEKDIKKALNAGKVRCKS